MVEVLGGIIVVLSAVATTVVVVVNCIVQEAAVVPLVHSLLSFPSLCTNSTSFSSMHISSLSIM